MKRSSPPAPHRRLAAIASLAVLVAGALAGISCRPPEPDFSGTEPVADLAELLPVAEAHREEAGFDFGTAAARPHLAHGFYGDEGSGDATLAWSRGEASTVRFFLAAPRALRAELRAEVWRELPGLTITPQVNGRALPPRALAAGVQEIVLDLPETALRAGDNRLTLAYSAVTEPRRSTGHRRLALAWYELRLRPLRPVEKEPRAEPPRIVALPLGTEVDYYLELPARSALTLGGLEAHGGAAGLEVVLQRDGEGERRLATLEPSARRQRLELPGGAGLARLALRPAAGPGSLQSGEIRLVEPAVRAGKRERTRTPGTGKTEKKAAVGAPEGSFRRPNVLLYLVDTLRADRLGCYGYAQPVSPHLDALARRAVLFERATAQAPWTRPSVASILTGMTPIVHGVQTLDDRLPEAAVTLPELLQAAGYETAALSTNYHVTRDTGMAQGFDGFFLYAEEPRSDLLTRRAVEWLDGRPGRGPFFLYVHALDPHAPYAPPADLRRRFADGLAPTAGSRPDVEQIYRLRGGERAARIAGIGRLYDAEVAANDRSFGELLAALQKRGLDDDTLIVFVSDHGEELGDRGDLGHGHTLYQELLHVPLLIKPPGPAAARRSGEPAEHIDLMPTILAAAGLAPPPGLPGIDLLHPGGRTHERAAISHLRYDELAGMSARAGSWKLILPFTRRLGEGPELYDLARDPGERRNLADDQPVRVGYLASQIRAERRRGERALPRERAVLGEEEEKALRALGY